MLISKSDYISYKQCPKSLWLHKNNPDLKDSLNQQKSDSIDKGNEVTEVARELFKGGKLVALDSNKKMVEQTQLYINNGETIIYEATFMNNGLLIRCDIMVKNAASWDLYEVKSSTKIKERYYDDITFQGFVLQNEKMNVTSYNIIYINNQYVRGNDLVVKDLFNIEDVTEEVVKRMKNLPGETSLMKKVIGQPTFEHEIGLHCEKYKGDDFPCWYVDHCFKHIPEYSVFDLSRIGKKKFDMYQEGIINIEDIPEDYPLTVNQQFQVTTWKEKTSIFQKAEVQEYLTQFNYPLYFVDFETYQQTIPLYKGIKPYQQIPFQYSLHILEDKETEIVHKEFLAKEGTDPRRAFAESLVNDIPKGVCTIAYNIRFEKMVIKELAALYPDLEEHLMNIHDNFIDLMTPFEKK